MARHAELTDELSEIWKALVGDGQIGSEQVAPMFQGQELTSQEAGYVFQTWIVEVLRLGGAEVERPYRIPFSPDINQRTQHEASRNNDAFAALCRFIEQPVVAATGAADSQVAPFVSTPRPDHPPEIPMAVGEDPRVVEFDVRTDEMLVNMGPQHPSTHGVLRLVLRTDGEVVSEVTPHIGYLHRCAEKIGENLTPRQWIPYTDRMDYLAAMNMNLGWALAVEKLLDYDLPEKARHLRVIIAEMGRVASHLVGMGAYGLDLGTFSPFLYAFREREKILDLFEEACGARLTYSYLTVGGATADLPKGWLQKCEAFLDQLEPIIQEYHTLLTTNAIFIKRTGGVGVMSPEMAIDYGTSGPVLRGSGVDLDLRRDGEERYTEMYDGYAFEVVVEKDGHYPKDHEYPPVPREAELGDCWHRFYVRMLEVIQAMDLVRQAMDRYSTAGGDWGTPVKLNQKLPKGEVYLETECPRGQMGFYLVSDGSAIPWRTRARSSSFCNLSVCHELCRGALIADVPAIVGSLDIVMGEIDR